MATLLQLVLNEPDHGIALETARQLAGLVDAVELGPGVLRTDDLSFLKALRDTVPDRPLICWAETEAEVEARIQAGIEGLTVPVSLSDEALSALIVRGRKAGRRVLLDLLSLSDRAVEEERWQSLGPDLLKVPVDVTVREVLGRLRGREIPVAFSGDWSVAQVPWLLLYQPVALIAGPVVTSSREPQRIVEAIRARMAIAPTMSRFY